MADLDFEAWVVEERARRADAEEQVIRPSLEVKRKHVRKLDRVARVQGMDRHQLLDHILETYFAPWRPFPGG